MKSKNYPLSKTEISRGSGKITKEKYWGFDKNLFFAVIFLLIFGLISIFNSSAVSAAYEFGDKYYFLKEQLKWLVLGLFLLLVCYKIPYRFWYQNSIYLLLGAIFLLLLVLVPGIGVSIKGARRWFWFGGQPSEFAKLAMIIYLSAWFSNKEKGRLWAFLLLCGIILGLILLQPDMGTTVVIGFIASILYFISGAPLLHFILLSPVVALGGYLLIKIAPYRFSRLTSFFNYNHDPLGSSYHIRQILISLGSGGIWGVGLGKSRQKYAYVPEANTDSIFAIIGEEIGFIGSFILIMVFFYIFIRGMRIAMKTSDKFGKLLAAGISTWIGAQMILNLSSMVSLTPLTGVPLPFISYGGSALIFMLSGIGILLNISRQRVEPHA